MSVTVKNAVSAANSAGWLGKQASAGTLLAYNSSAIFALPAATMEMIPYKETANQDFMDGSVIANAQTYVKQVGGVVGGFSCLAQPDVVGRLLAIMFNDDTVSGTNPNYEHLITSDGDFDTWATLFQRLGDGTHSMLQAFGDIKMQNVQLTFGGGQDGGAMIQVSDALSINAGEYKATEPTAAVSSTDKAVEWANVEGTIDINGSTITTVNGESLLLNREYDIKTGDSPYIKSLIGKKGVITRSFDTYLSEETLPILKNALYGTTTPSAGDEITANVVEISAETTYTTEANRFITISTPKILVNVQDMVGELKGDVDGGSIDMTIGGICVTDGTDPAVSVTVGSAVSVAFI